jgi:hypothetical protein
LRTLRTRTLRSGLRARDLRARSLRTGLSARHLRSSDLLPEKVPTTLQNLLPVDVRPSNLCPLCTCSLC